MRKRSCSSEKEMGALAGLSAFAASLALDLSFSSSGLDVCSEYSAVFKILACNQRKLDNHRAAYTHVMKTSSIDRMILTSLSPAVFNSASMSAGHQRNAHLRCSFGILSMSTCSA